MPGTVVVIGGGIAGCSVALALAEKGYQVTDVIPAVFWLPNNFLFI